MRLNHGMIALMLSASTFALSTTGCASSELVYDPYRHDYYRWNRGEDRMYREWEVEGYRTHVAFQRRGPSEQRAYWDWRHGSERSARRNTR
jgi:hypothetical protein